MLASEPPQPAAETSQNEEEEEEKGQFVTRFSAFAPDPNLPTEDFRAQLKENMKADLERRRRENPSRGHQPAKTYLDSLSNNEWMNNYRTAAWKNEKKEKNIPQEDMS